MTMKPFLTEHFVPGTVLSAFTIINSFYHLMISLNQFISGKRSKTGNLGKGDESQEGEETSCLSWKKSWV